MVSQSPRIICQHVLRVSRLVYKTKNSLVRQPFTHELSFPLSSAKPSIVGRAYASKKPPTSSLVAATFIKELQKANINLTEFGKQKINTCFKSIPPSRLKATDLSWILYGNFRPFASDTSLSRLNSSPISPWRVQSAFEESLNSKVHKMWEALYSNSELFHKMIDFEENDLEEMLEMRVNGELKTQYLWQMLSSMLRGGFFEPSDVDKLPEPFKFSSLPPPPYPEPQSDEDNDE
ncbi:hypothetical protein AA313_de0209457 [Arthrobotrys entomopaga]|nr:hypothetical protein AA313_de0209457 [Arthrobotrys entomopaga]